VLTERDRDPFPRRTADPAVIAPWLVELGRTLPDLLRSYLPGAPIDARSREQVILAVTEVNGCRYCAWIHGSWSDYLGQVDDPAEVLDVLLAHARASAEAGRPLDPAPLAAVLPPEVVAGLRATVAQIEVANLVGNTVDGLLARATRKRPLDPLKAVGELATVAVALPVAVPMLAVGGAFRLLRAVAPALPEVDVPPAGEANLLVHLLARAVPSYLANAGLRLALLNLPAPVSVGITAGRTSATLRIGRGGVAVSNGISPDAALVVEGDIEPLLQLATGHLVREIGSLRVKRP
jgi:alkylhydroperoxidase family enzyme